LNYVPTKFIHFYLSVLVLRSVVIAWLLFFLGGGHKTVNMCAPIYKYKTQFLHVTSTAAKPNL
jgi:hypothetical protein